MPYLWLDAITDYQTDNVADHKEIIEVKRLNFFIGRNNAGKSRFLRILLTNRQNFHPVSELNEEIILNNITTSIKNFAYKYDSRNQYTGVKFNPQYYTVENKQFENEEELLRFFKNYMLTHRNLLKIQSHKRRKNLSNLIQHCYVMVPNAHTQENQEITLNINHPCENYSTEIKFPNYATKYYIPTLRGMRPVSDDLQVSAYQNRNVKDYEIEANAIITGENLYKELQERLLGEPEDRQLIQDYQNVLSRYFFDNETITLIPKIKDDVVHIKIGDAKQFPIYHLGDGLQQAIILTYDAFLRKNEINAYFVEEPELHMHAGMVRQLMNFYLNETEHYYFFTTHSNHLLDMADESDEVMIQKFSKQKVTDDNRQEQTFFQINRCDRDRELLQSLGVKPSSVYLANCTIWVEGITDRLYLIKYMNRYLQYLKKLSGLEELEELGELEKLRKLEELKSQASEKYENYRRFMLHYHYAFVEYAGSNMVHWSFEDVVNNVDGLQNKGLSARAVASNMLLIADADSDKANRIENLNTELGEDKFHLLEVKEIENTLPKDLIVQAAKNRFEKMRNQTKIGFEIELLNDETRFDFNDTQNGIGLILDNAIREKSTEPNKYCFATESGTINDKLNFCREILKLMDESDWQLTKHARELAEDIFKHIQAHN